MARPDPAPRDAPPGDAADPAQAAWTPRRLALLALTALALWLCWLVAKPFVASLTWATALAVVAWPLQRRFVRYLRRPGLAAFLTCSVVFIAIGVPTTVLVPQIVEQGANAVDLGHDWIASGEPVALSEMGDTLHATLVGKVLVSLLQGALGGAMFFVLGVPAALFWSVVMAVCALLPVLGTPVVWGPAALWLLIDGSWVKATILAVWGTAVVGVADNLLYPMIVGNRVHLHTVPMLLSMVGGIFVFGMAGFFVGPAVLGATLALLRIWAARAGGVEAVPPGVARDAPPPAVSPRASARKASAAPPR